MQTPNLNYQKWLFICIGLMVFGIGVGFVGFPKLLRKLVKGVSNSAGFLYDMIFNSCQNIRKNQVGSRNTYNC